MTDNHFDRTLPSELCSHLGFVLAKAFQELHARFETETASYGIEPRHLGVLLLTTKRGPMRQNELSDALRLDRTTITYLVDDLEQRGWARRHPDPDDRRARRVQVTDEGAHVLEALRPHVESAEAGFLDPLTEKQSEQLRALLAKLV